MSSVNSIVGNTARKVIGRAARSQSFRSKSRAALAAAALAGMATAAHSATRYYDTNGTTAGFANASGTWNLVNTNWSTDSAGSSANVTWVQGDDARFNTTSGNPTVTVGTALTVGDLMFANTASAYTINGTAANNITLSSVTMAGTATTQNLNATIAGTNLTVSNVTTSGDTTLAMSVSVANANTFTGDLILAGSGTGRNQVSIVTRSALPAATTVKFQRDQSQFNFGGSVGTQTFANNFVLNSLGAAGTFTSYIGCNGGNIVTLNGTVAGPSGTANSDMVFQTGSNGGVGVLILNTAMNYSGSTSLNNGQNTTGNTGVIRIGNNNILPVTTALRFAPQTSEGVGSGGSGALDLNGFSQTVASLGSNTTGQIGGITNTAGGTGTLVLKGTTTTAYSGNIGVPPQNTIPSGTPNNNVALTLDPTHTGTTTLTRATGTTYSGGTTIGGGTLLVNNTSGSGTGSGAVVVNGGRFGGNGFVDGNVTVNGVDATTKGRLVPGGVGGTPTTFSIGGTAGSTLTLNEFSAITFDFNASTNDKVAVIGTNGNLVLPATGVGYLEMNDLTGTAIFNNTYTLMTYTGTLTGDPLTTLSVVNPPTGGAQGATFTLVNNTALKSIDVTVTGAANAITWTGASNTTWDVNNNTNWTGATSKFINGDVVTFDDSASGSGTVTVDVAGTVQPALMTFSNASRDYVVQGGTITDFGGATTLQKTAGAKLTLTGTNNFSGQIVLTGGTIAANSGAALGSTTASGAGAAIIMRNATTLQATGNITTARGIDMGVGGGGIIDTNGFDVTINYLFTNSVATAAVKNGGGILTTTTFPTGTGYAANVALNGGGIRVNAASGTGLSGIGRGTITMATGTSFHIDNANVGDANGTNAPILMMAGGTTLKGTGTASYGRSSGLNFPNNAAAIDIQMPGASDVLTLKNSLRHAVASTSNTTVARVNYDAAANYGQGRLVLESGGFSPTSNTAFAGSWELYGGKLQLGPAAVGGTGEPLNSLGYRGDPKLADPVTLFGGTLVGASDAANPNASPGTTPNFYRNPLTFSGGSLASTGVNSNWGGDFLMTGVATTISVADAVTANTARNVNLVAGAAGTNNNAATTTWDGALTVTKGASTVGGAFNINRDGGTINVVPGASINVVQGATVNLGGTADALFDGVDYVNVVNNSTTSFNATQGSKNIGNLSGTGNTSVSSGATLTIHETTPSSYGVVSGAGTFVKDGSATISIDHADIDALSVAQGTLKVTSSGGNEAGLGSKNSHVSTLTMTSGTTIDLTNNNLIIEATDFADSQTKYAAAEALVKSGFGNFDWLGTGIVSSTAAAQAQIDGSRALGIINNNDWGHGDIEGDAVGFNDVIIKYTWVGDANVDGLVDNDDFGQFLAGFSGSPAQWVFGDFDYNGVIDNDDFGWFLTGLTAFQSSGNTQLSDSFRAELMAFASEQGIPLVLDPAPVPEPTTMGLLGIVGAGALARRRRR